MVTTVNIWMQSSLRGKALVNAKAPSSHMITLGQGDTLISLLRRSGVNKNDIKAAVRMLSPELDLRQLQVNQTFELKLQSLNGETRLMGLTVIGTTSGHLNITLPLKEEKTSSAGATTQKSSKKPLQPLLFGLPKWTPRPSFHSGFYCTNLTLAM